MRKIKLGDVCKINEETYSDGNSCDFVNYLDTSNITANHIENIQHIEIAQEKLPSRARRKVKFNSIIYSTVRPNQRHYGIIKSQPENFLVSTGFAVIDVDPKKIDANFLYYQLSRDEIVNNLQSIAEQSTTAYPSIKPSDLSNLEFYVPSLDTQRKIGNFLYALDDKIALNKKINATLESMAKTLYDYWFVQFDFPDENGKPYKTSGGKMIYSSELGRDIPIDWELGKLSKLIKSVTTGLNPRDNFVLNTGGDIKYVTVKNLTLNGRIDFSNCDCVDEDARNLIHERSNISKGDVLFASIAPIGRCFLIQEEPCNWEINESVFSIRPSNFTTSEFLYMYLKSNGFVKLASSSSTGSIFKGIRINTLMETPTVIPPKNISEQFKNKLSKLLSKLNQSDEESRRLAELRDWLLPMLMNGQIQFKET